MSETTNPSGPAILWFREDLRLGDNPALDAARENPAGIVPVFILEDDNDGPRPRGGASRWWLHHSLNALAQSLQETGAPLLLRRGNSTGILMQIAEETGACEIHWNRRYAPGAVKADTATKKALCKAGLAVKSHNARLLAEPWEIETTTGGPYKVFTPFWKALRAKGWRTELYPRPRELKGAGKRLKGDDLADWGLLPDKPDWAKEFADLWQPGEMGARERLKAFLDNGLDGYAWLRDRPDCTATSRLSPHLHFGEISPQAVAIAVTQACDASAAPARDGDKFLSELGWREFSHHLLYHFPSLPSDNLQDKFDGFSWREDAGALKAWQRGRTGYPIIDAGMRELWRHGTMHNRVRMIVASFLIKDLMIDWRQGETWFWDTLVDADAANNAASWQWVAGSGADAAPFFRIFNPVLQGQKYDPDGAYVRRLVPEIAKLPDKYIHTPWTAPEDVLGNAGVKLGDTYPRPIVDHGCARERALEAFRAL